MSTEEKKYLISLKLGKDECGSYIEEKWLTDGPVLQTLPNSWLSKFTEKLIQNCVEKEINAPDFEEMNTILGKTKSTYI